MPLVVLEDGRRLFVDSDDPEEIEQAKQKSMKRRKTGSSGSLAGDIGRGIGAGLVSIPQGLVTLPTTGIDLLFNTEVTDNVNEFFKGIKPEVEGTAGKTAQMIAQFGVPGLGTASALSKLSKVKQLGAIGAVDAAVATDDVDTFADMIFDKESDEERIKNLAGRDAAAARLKERMQVFAETASFVYAVPKVVGGTFKAAGAGLDMAAPAVGAGLDLIAPYMTSLANKVDPNRAIAAATRADKNMFDYLRKKFSYGGTFEQTAKNNKLISDLFQAEKSYASNLGLASADSFDNIRRTMETAVAKGGKLNDKDALEFVKLLSTYRAPLLVVEREFPTLTGVAKKAKMKQLQDEALKKIKSFEGSGNKIDYKALGIDSDNYVSSILKNNKGIFAQEEKLLYEAVQGKKGKTIAGLTLDTPFIEALRDNRGSYGTTLYRAMMIDGFQPTKEVYDTAINKIITVFDLPPSEQQRSTAISIFNELKNPSNSKNAYETPELLLNNIKGGQLKGKTLKSLPEIREALGEIRPQSYKEGSEWRQALTDETVAAGATISKVGALVANIKVYDDIRYLNDNALAKGTTPFLRTASDLEAVNISPVDFKTKKLRDSIPAEEMDDGVKYLKFNDNQGALQDTYAPEVFVDAVTGSTKAFKIEAPDILMGAYKGLLALKTVGQYNKTLLSVGAHIRNNTSIPLFAAMNGNLGPSADFLGTLKKSFAGVLDPKGKTKYNKELKEGREYGIVVGRGTQLEEIADLASYADSDLGLMKKLQSNGLTSRIIKAANVARKPIERVYTGSDNAARWINWNGEQAKLAKVIADSADDAFIPVNAVKSFSDSNIQKLIRSDRTINVGELKKLSQEFFEQQSKEKKKEPINLLDKFIKGEAADIALNVTPTYSRTPQIVKELKFIPVFGNFTAFPSEIIRNTGNTMSRGIKELTSNNAELQKVGMRRLTSALTTTVGVPAGLVATGLALTGAKQEQIDAYKRSFAAPWEKTATMIPTSTDSSGNITSFINYSYTNPYDFLQRPVKAVLNAVATGNRNEASLMSIASNSMVDMAGEIANPFLSTSIGANSLLEAYSGKTSTGKIIYNESDELGDKGWKSTAHILNSIAPTVLPISVQVDAEGTQFVPKDFVTAAASVFTGEENLISPKGKPIDVAETMVQAFSGIKVVKPQLERSLYYKAAESKRAIRETTNEFNRLLRSNNRRDAESFVKGYINTNEDRYNSLRTLYTAIEDARTLGVPDYAISEQLKIAKVANRDLVMLGIFKPSEVNQDVLNFALQGTDIKAPQNVPIGDLASASIDLTGQSLQGQFQAPNLAQPSRASQLLREEEEKKILGI